jgi:hypothetical protein
MVRSENIKLFLSSIFTIISDKNKIMLPEMKGKDWFRTIIQPENNRLPAKL